MSTPFKYASPLYDPATPYYAGAGSSALVPYPFPISVAGRPYQVQWDHTIIGVWGAKFKRESLPLLRQQADASNTPGEQSISPEQFWRRSQETWHYGSGQTHLDRANSELRRFSTSKGIDCWTPWKLKLLNTTSLKKSSANSSLAACVAGTKVYFMDGTALTSSTDLTTWTAVTGISATAGSSIDTDGNTVYIANGADGVYSSTVSGTTAAQYNTGTASLVRFVKSRLMVAGGGKLYNVTGAGALPTALLDLSARSFTWVDITAGQSQIYAAGYAGDKSLIYRTGLLADATALAAPIVAGELPDGEIVRSINAYLGYVVIGSDLGVRFCSVNSDGSLTIGALISTTSPVYCFEGQDRFIWYGLTNYDTTSTGLARMDLTTFNGTLVPAYATDLMATGQGTVRSVVTFGNYRLFTVDGLGLYYETANTPVASGNLVTGLIGYGISDNKVGMFVDLKHQALTGTIQVSVASNGGTAIDIGTSSLAGSDAPTSPLPVGQVVAEEFNLTITLTSASATSPVLNRWTLRSYPIPKRSGQWDIPIMLYDTITIGDKDWPFDTGAEYTFLSSLFNTGTIVNLQIANSVYQVTLYDFIWLPELTDSDNDGSMSGNFYAQFREIAG